MNEHGMEFFFFGAEERLKDGDKAVILDMLAWCFIYDEPPPKWLKDAFITGWAKIVRFDVKSLEDAFGSSLPKGKWMAARKRRREISLPIYAAVNEAKVKGSKVDRHLYSRIGKKFGIKGSLCNEIYDEVAANKKAISAFEKSFAKPDAPKLLEFLRSHKDH